MIVAISFKLSRIDPQIPYSSFKVLWIANRMQVSARREGWAVVASLIMRVWGDVMKLGEIETGGAIGGFHKALCETVMPHYLVTFVGVPGLYPGGYCVL